MTLKNQSKQAKEPASRRSFLNIFWWVLAGLGLVEAGAVTLSFLGSRKGASDDEESKSIVVAGKAGDFAPNTVTAFPQGRFYLVCLQDGGFLALSRQCTHLGCTVPWVEAENKFICPCHASSFGMEGNVLSAPAPRPLDLFAIQIKNRNILVNVKKRIQRSRFRPDQVAYARSKTSNKTPGNKS